MVRLRNLSAVKPKIASLSLLQASKTGISGNRAQMDRTMQVYHTGCLVKLKIGYCCHSVQYVLLDTCSLISFSCLSSDSQGWDAGRNVDSFKIFFY